MIVKREIIMKKFTNRVFCFYIIHPYFTPFLFSFLLSLIVLSAIGAINNNNGIFLNFFCLCLISFMSAFPFWVGTFIYNLFKKHFSVTLCKNAKDSPVTEDSPASSTAIVARGIVIGNKSKENLSKEYFDQKAEATQIAAREERENEQLRKRMEEERQKWKARILSYSKSLSDDTLLLYAADYAYLFKLITKSSLMFAIPFIDEKEADCILSYLCRHKILTMSTDGITYGCLASKEDLEEFRTFLSEENNLDNKDTYSHKPKSLLSLGLDPMCTLYMTGKEFENFCAYLLAQNGFHSVFLVGGSGDGGVDIMAEKDGTSYAIQCKCYTSPVGSPAVRDTFSGAAFHKKDVAVLMTNSIFTEPAKQTAQGLGVSLWDYYTLQNMCNNAKSAKKNAPSAATCGAFL